MLASPTPLMNRIAIGPIQVCELRLALRELALNALHDAMTAGMPQDWRTAVAHVGLAAKAAAVDMDPAAVREVVALARTWEGYLKLDDMERSYAWACVAAPAYLMPVPDRPTKSTPARSPNAAGVVDAGHALPTPAEAADLAAEWERRHA